MLMEHAFYETTIGEKWNVCGMDYIAKVIIEYNSNDF